MQRALRELLTEKQFRILLLLSVVARMIAIYLYHPAPINDAQDYLLLAERISRFDLSADQGFRTPVYPLFLALLGSNLWAVYLVQSLIGIVISILLYVMFRQVSGNCYVALTCASFYAVNPSSLLFEAAIMTETLSTFLIVLTVFLAMRILDNEDLKPSAFFMLGLVSSLAGLTRPPFQLLPLVLLAVLLYLFYLRGKVYRRKTVVISVTCLLIPFLVLILGWSALNKARFNWFTLTTAAGYNLTNHSGKFIELAPPEYKVITDAYVPHRDAKGMTPGVINKAIPTIRAATGWSYAELSRKLASMSYDLFLHHPISYGFSVIQSMGLFLFPALYYDGYSIKGFFRLEEPALIYAYAFFYMSLMAAFVIILLRISFKFKRHRKLLTGDFVIFLVIFVYTAVVTSMVEFGENARYKFPVEALLLGWTIYLIYALRTPSNGHPLIGPVLKFARSVHAGAKSYSFKGMKFWRSVDKPIPR